MADDARSLLGIAVGAGFAVWGTLSLGSGIDELPAVVVPTEMDIVIEVELDDPSSEPPRWDLPALPNPFEETPAAAGMVVRYAVIWDIAEEVGSIDFAVLGEAANPQEADRAPFELPSLSGPLPIRWFGGEQAWPILGMSSTDPRAGLLSARGADTLEAGRR